MFINYYIYRQRMNKHNYSLKLTMQARSCRQRLSNMSTVRLQLRSQVLSLGTRLRTTTTWKGGGHLATGATILNRIKLKNKLPFPPPKSNLKIHESRFFPILNLGRGSGGLNFLSKIVASNQFDCSCKGRDYIHVAPDDCTSLTRTKRGQKTPKKLLLTIFLTVSLFIKMSLAI